MRSTFEGLDNIKIFENGVSDKEFKDDGYTIFEAWTLDKPERAKRRDSLGARDMAGHDLFSISFITIDNHVEREKLDNINFIKIDVDGYELRVLRGAEKTIMRYRPLILIELSYMIDDIGDSVEEFLDMIYDKLGYTLYTQGGEKWGKDTCIKNYPWHTSFDMMMIPNEIEFEDIKK